MNSPIDLRRTQHAVWLAQELSFSRAAQRAHLSQTAFSRSIQALEASLGLQLFDRSTRHVVVTAVGGQWLAQAQAALSQADNLSTDRKFNRMRPSMARVLGLETRSAKEG